MSEFRIHIVCKHNMLPLLPITRVFLRVSFKTIDRFFVLKFAKIKFNFYVFILSGMRLYCLPIIYSSRYFRYSTDIYRHNKVVKIYSEILPCIFDC